jgi:hypothetical protein
MARMATSVLPKPTSPQTKRSMGRVLFIISDAIIFNYEGMRGIVVMRSNSDSKIAKAVKK